jgi:LuxR family maltose regulon positive regulatory protein
MEWLERGGYIDQYPTVAVYGASVWAELGQAAAAERWAIAAERATSVAQLADGVTMAAMLAQLRLQLCRDGIDAMRRDAEFAQAQLAAGSTLRALAYTGEALAYYLERDVDRADAIFAHAIDIAVHDGAFPVASSALALRFLIAEERGDGDAAEQYIRRAVEFVEHGSLDEYATSGMVYACAARAALHRGDIERARGYVAEAARLRPTLTYALPHVSAIALLELARAYISLADPAGARAVLREARDIFVQRPDLGRLPAEAKELEHKLDSMRAGSAGASALTTAELRLLPLLATHLTFPEIGERLHVSRHTVKTQAISIYQKLGVSSRSEAIARVHEFGLLGV